MMAVNETMGSLVMLMMSVGNECMIQCTAACRKLSWLAATSHVQKVATTHFYAISHTSGGELCLTTEIDVQCHVGIC